jgi:hypothetical protein
VHGKIVTSSRQSMIGFNNMRSAYSGRKVMMLKWIYLFSVMFLITACNSSPSQFSDSEKHINSTSKTQDRSFDPYELNVKCYARVCNYDKEIPESESMFFQKYFPFLKNKVKDFYAFENSRRDSRKAYYRFEINSQDFENFLEKSNAQSIDADNYRKLHNPCNLQNLGTSWWSFSDDEKKVITNSSSLRCYNIFSDAMTGKVMYSPYSSLVYVWVKRRG